MLFNHMNLEGVLIEDQKKDTLLSAGVLQVRLTDWFFLKDKVDLEYIGLRNATVKLQRTDSVWNYQYLVDYFSSPSTGQKKESGIELNLKKVVLENVSFTQRDAWQGADAYIKVGGLDMDARELSLSKNIFDIQRLWLDGPVYHEFSYTGRRSAASKAAAAARSIKPDTATLRWNPGRLYLHISQLELKNGRFRSDKDGVLGSTLPHFDGRHIDFLGITGNLRELRFLNDTLSAQTDLVTRERGGLDVKQLRTHLRFHPELMEFGKLSIKTNRSTLRNHFAMRFKSWDDLGDFENKVRMEGHFEDALIASDDIAIFAPDLATWDRLFHIDGVVKGTVDALEGRDVKLRTGQTALNGNFTVQGLTDPTTVFLNVEADDLVTNYNEAVVFVPALRKVTTPNLRALGTIRFSGTYTGFFNDFVTYGTLHTSLGSLRTDLNMKLPDGGVPVYSGNISTASFNLGRFFNNSDLGIVDFNGQLKGRGFTQSQLAMDVNGTVRRFQLGTYTYQNITAKGHLTGSSFNGDFAINDPNARLRLNGLITYGGKRPTFDAKAGIDTLNLRALGFSKEELSLRGRFDLNLSGASLSDFLGQASISDATLMHDGRRLSFDSLYVSSTFYNGVRTLQARSNELYAKLQGQFDLATLPDAFQLFLNRYYPAYIKPPRLRALPRQAFTFDITTGAIEDYLKLFDRRISGGNGAHIKGSLDVGANSLVLDAQVPGFGYDQYRFSGISLKGDGNFSRLIVDGDVAHAAIGDSVSLPQTKFNIQARNDVSDVSITTSSNLAVNQASLSAQVHTFSDGLSLLFNPSSFLLNGKTWTIEQGGTLDFRRNTVTQGNVVLKESNQEIRLSTVPSEDGNNLNDLHVALKNLNLGDITPFFVPSNRIEGLLNGSITIEDPANRFLVRGQVETDQLRVDNDSIGQLAAQVTYNKKTGRLTGSGNNRDPEHRLAFDLDMDLDDSANLHTDRISIEPVNYPVTYLQNFVGSLFTDLRGNVTGRLNIVGEGAARRFVGKARLINAGLKVNFTQVFYTIDDTEIELREDRIDFGTLRLRDRYGKPATLRGSIAHEGFKDMVFDLLVRTDGEPVELLNTTYNDNQTFYGRARGTGSFRLTGPQANMNMEIDARPSNRDSSYITLPPSKTRESGAAADFMVERKYGTEMTPATFANAATNVNYTVNLTANPLVNVEVILDDLTGDAISGRGTGDLTLESGTNKPLSLRGRYNIEEGKYLFTFQSFFKKPFELRKGANNYIQWNGDPYAAQIRFEAIYKAENVRFAPLVTSLALNDTRLERLRGDVNVAATLTGELFRPNFAFHLEFPENSPVNTNPSFTYGLQQIERNPNEINKQVTYLIVFNSFAPYQGDQSNSGGAFNEFAYSTISGLFFGEVNRLLNQVLGKVLSNNKLTLNFSGSLYNRNLLTQNNRGFGINTGTINVGLTAPAGERVQITFGGTFDVPIPGNNDINQRINVYPDVSVDVLINKTGSIRATFFYTQSPDLLVSGANTNTIRNQRAGAKLSYRKEFDSFGDLFRRKKKEPVADSTRPNQEADDSTLRQRYPGP
ncbi:translocation/assembly module TamB domain-containing protein [Flaviaesturariibacter amylovorans]|uniref:translocation/assembly module TamB domain-containing protein n=1 Tax=Flaviaesturariibacter amylovorans TaxID=1084520 RepID=UPI0031E9415D